MMQLPALQARKTLLRELVSDDSSQAQTKAAKTLRSQVAAIRPVQ